MQTQTQILNSLRIRASLYRKTSDKYKIIDTDMVNESIHNALNTAQVGKFESTIKTNGGCKGSKHLMEVNLDDMGIDVLGDKTTPKILVWNSFNGECSLNVMVGLYRFVCANGLILGKDVFNEKVIHRNGDTATQKLQMLEYQIVEAVRFIEKNLNDKMEMLKKDTNKLTQLKIVNELGFSKRLTKNVKERIINPVREADKQENLWATYNIINEVIRNNSRSQFSEAVKNVNLMGNIVDAYNKVAA